MVITISQRLDVETYNRSLLLSLSLSLAARPLIRNDVATLATLATLPTTEATSYRRASARTGKRATHRTKSPPTSRDAQAEIAGRVVRRVSHQQQVRQTAGAIQRGQRWPQAGHSIAVVTSAYCLLPISP